MLHLKRGGGGSKKMRPRDLERKIERKQEKNVGEKNDEGRKNGRE